MIAVITPVIARSLSADLGQLELERRNDVLFLRRALAVPEKRRLAEVIVEARAAATDLGRLDRFGGWWRPWHYGDAVAEYWSVREGVSIGDVSTLGKLVVSGPDVVDFTY